MVFSFFKKPPQKMPERPAAKPRAPAVQLPEAPRPVAPVEEVKPLEEPLPDLEFSLDPAPKPAAPPAPPLAVLDEADFDMAEFDRDFTESSVMAINVANDIDPLQADIEQAVVLFANGQDGAARSLLENLIRVYPGSEGLRFWQLLFDLLQVTDDRASFEKLSVEFAEACETSPPTWRDQHHETVCPQTGEKRLVLQGVLTEDALQPLLELDKAVAQKLSAIIDCSRLIGCDDVIAGQFAELLGRARRAGVALRLEQPEAFLGRLNDRLQAGEAAHAPAWALLLELLQRYGTQEQFEERAVDYAVTFELSPPSWESLPAVAAAVPTAPPVDDALYLAGELKSCRFADLAAFIEAREAPVIDFSGVRRMDFFSAGQLVNRLAPFKAAGREVVVRSPNHLVAELMAVVGLNKQARIIVPKS